MSVKQCAGFVEYSSKYLEDMCLYEPVCWNIYETSLYVNVLWCDAVSSQHEVQIIITFKNTYCTNTRVASIKLFNLNG